MKAKKEAKEKYPELNFDFTFHDLKTNEISDLSVSLYDKQAISGHKMHRKRQDDCNSSSCRRSIIL